MGIPKIRIILEKVNTETGSESHKFQGKPEAAQACHKAALKAVENALCNIVPVSP